jgi:hypothetical protein
MGESGNFLANWCWERSTSDLDAKGAHPDFPEDGRSACGLVKTKLCCFERNFAATAEFAELIVLAV